MRVRKRTRTFGLTKNRKNSMILLKRIIELWMKANFLVTMLILHQRIFFRIILYFSTPNVHFYLLYIVTIVFHFSMTKAIASNINYFDKTDDTFKKIGMDYVRRTHKFYRIIQNCFYRRKRTFSASG